MTNFWKHTARVGVACLMLFPVAAFAVPVVTYIYPSAQRVDAPTSTVIRVQFNETINPATVDDISFRVYGRWSGPASGTLNVTGAQIEFTPSVPFFAGEWITVNVSRTLENMSGEPLARGYAWNFWTKTAAGTLDLTYLDRVTVRQGGESWVQVYGAYAGDLNNDGWSDFSAPCEQTSDVRIFMNDGAGDYSTFTTRAVPGGSIPSPNEGADFNNDGEIDLVVGNTGNSNVGVMFGDGAGHFPTTIYYTAASSVRGVGVVDLNGDGWDDIVTANRFGNNMGILINNGDGTFASTVLQDTGGTNEYAIAVADANNDGLLDVFVGCFNFPYDMVVMLSDGDGNLTAVPGPTGAEGQPWQIVAGDFNGDGNVDIASCNTNQNRFVIMLGDGHGNLAAPYSRAVGSFPLAIDAGDIDGDGDLDVVTSNYGAGSWSIYENTGTSFGATAHTLLASSAGSCAVLHDRDNDGDLDLSGLDEVDDWIYLYDNQLPATSAAPPARAEVLSLENTPNPFNPSTSIRFELSSEAQVRLTVYDASGARVTTLYEGRMSSGAHAVRWNGTDSGGERVGSGVYFCRLEAGGETMTRKLVLLK